MKNSQEDLQGSWKQEDCCVSESVSRDESFTEWTEHCYGFTSTDIGLGVRLWLCILLNWKA